MSELVYSQLLRDPRRNAAEFARASLDYGSEVLVENPRRAEEVLSLALETLHLPLEPHEAELASQLAGALVDVSYRIDRPDRRLRAVRVEQELMANSLVPSEPGQSAVLRCLAAGALIELDQWSEAVHELAAAVAESAQMRSDDLFARVITEVVLASRSGRLGSVNVSGLEQNLSIVRQQSLDGARTVGCLVALASVRLVVGDGTSAQLYERRIGSIASPDELDDVGRLALSWIYMNRRDYQGALQQIESIQLPPLEAAAVKPQLSDIASLAPGSDPRVWAETLVAQGDCLVKLGQTDRGIVLLERSLELPALGAAGRARAHEALADVAASSGRHEDAYQFLVSIREAELDKSRQIAQRLSAHEPTQMPPLALLDLPLPDEHGAELGAEQHAELPSAPEPHEIAAPSAIEPLVDISDGRDQSAFDPMTGLPTRLTLRFELAKLAETTKSLMVIVFDVDRLGRLNETVGHDMGDRLLVEISRRLLDLSLANTVVGRWGGDEFVLAVGGVNTLSNAVMTANEVRDQVCASWDPQGADSRIVPSLTMGMSLTLDRHVDPDALLRNADTALQKARSTNKGGIEIFGEHLAMDAQYRFETEYLLRDALDYGWFELFFQPLYSNETGRPYAAEALVRLQHPQLGTLAPGSFLHVAEETGLARDIGLWVIDRACLAAAAYRQLDDKMVVTVNVSAGQLTDDFPDLVAAAMVRNGVTGSSLIVELTEHTLLVADDTQVAALRRLHRLGIRIALDDFGTKYSSFDHLRKFPIDVVKIDQSFVSGICTDPHDAAIVEAVVGLAKSFGFQVVAEGVETAEQLDRQRALGCTAAQGFLIGKPAPMQDFADLLAALTMFDGVGAALQQSIDLTASEVSQPQLGGIAPA